ncbi:MAG: hypothetical protein NW207_09155 [Cytophagales bacterium]|nr:hypothetical protein [Cytophagales bacterium]
MGVVKTIIKLSNTRFAEILPLEVEALAHTGALHLCISETQAIQLKLEEAEKRPLTLADGSIYMIPYAGPVKVDWNGIA